MTLEEVESEGHTSSFELRADASSERMDRTKPGCPVAVSSHSSPDFPRKKSRS